MKKNPTRLATLEQAPRAKRFADLDPKDLRKTVGGLRPSVTTGACTTCCDDWCDCD